MESELIRFKKVNDCQTLEELAIIIENFADENGYIQGRTKSFLAKNMAMICRRYSKFEHNLLTREYGIRQQALYILFYNNETFKN